MGRLDWLFARPIAHRGLHDRTLGVVENTPGAVARAVEHGYAVEIDIQISADGEAVVFHDATLDRLTEGEGPVSAVTLGELRKIPFRETSDRIWTLAECLELMAGRQALVVEIKSDFSATAAARTESFARSIAGREAPVAAKSFDPRVVAALRRRTPRVPRGAIGEAFADADPYWAHLSPAQRFAARNLLHWPVTRPDFLSWKVQDLDRKMLRMARYFDRPIMSWTVRSAADEAHALHFADQIVFEGFMPSSAQNR